MVLDWIFKRLITPERVGDLIKNNQVVITEALKDSIKEILEDEEIAQGVVMYTDGIYNRYLGKSGKLWGTLGGVQKGVNYAIQGEIDQKNPIAAFLNEDEGFNIAGIFKKVALNFLTPKQPGSGSRGSPSQGTRRTPNMQRI